MLYSPIQANHTNVPPTHSQVTAGGSESLIRIADLLITLVVGLFALPLIILTALAVGATSRGPIFFVQQRVGAHGKTFPCYKFRTMVRDADVRLQQLLEADPKAKAIWERDRKLPNDPRVTLLGNFLRLSSFDELPQLWNVLRGDMSLVGPRPIVKAEVERYRRYIAYYYAVRPGITGLWQVSGRSDTTYRRRVAFDVSFVRNYCIGQYMKILFKTVPAVVFARGSC